MPIQKALLEEYGNRRMEPETRLLLEEFKSQGIPVEVFTRKQMQRGKVVVLEERCGFGRQTND